MKHILIIASIIAISASCNNSGSRKAVPVSDSKTEKLTSAGSPHSGGEMKMNFSIEAAENGVSISELYSGKKSYQGKTVIVKGMVTKINPGIMERNWIHLQDGTDHNGNFDLTVTSDQLVEPGEVTTVKGIISLDKDFGYGYFYEVIMEDAVIIGD